MTALGLGLGGALGPLGAAVTESTSTAFEVSVIDSLEITDIAAAALGFEVVEGLGLSPQEEITLRSFRTVTDGLGLTDVVSTFYGVILTEALKLSPVVVANQKANLTVTETLGLLEQLIPGLPVTITEGLGLTIVQAIQQATTVIEELGLTDVVTPNAKYHLSWTDTIRFAESLANFFGADVVEGLGLTATPTPNMLYDLGLSEGLGLAATQVANLVLRVEIDEGLGLADVDLLNAIYHGTIAEGLGLSLAYVSPGGGFTTWAMNTRTGSVTEYANYEFNSFARLGHKYIGATSDGLYELIGDDDDGTDIIARLKSGFAQWAGSRFTILKGIYLGVRGEGDFVLKVITGDDKTYTYAVSTNNMRSTRVRTGKGIRSRYLRFELISTGQDFDLESIEFVPLVAQRRV